MFNRIISPIFTGSINYKINTVDIKVAKEIINFRVFNKKKGENLR